MPKSRITIPVFVPHAGCPHSCVFCNQWKVSGCHRESGPDDVDRAVSIYLSSAAASVKHVEIAFFGGSFTGIDQDTQRLLLSRAESYVRTGRVRSIRLSTRPDYINADSVDLLKEFSVETVELGVQSFDDEVLAASNRGHGAGDVFRAVSILKENGFRTGIQLMPGLPGDSREKSVKSAETAVSLKPDDARIYPCVVLAGTGLDKLYMNGLYKPLSIEDAVETSALIYRLFHENNINVIRIGLHPLDTPGTAVIAGPYHTAMGFLVKSRYRRFILDELFSKSSLPASDCKTVKLMIPAHCAEEFIGMKRANIEYLKEKYSLNRIEYRTWENEHPEFFS